MLVSIDVEDNTLRIKVADNGQGFPFQGRRGQDSLQAMGCGPATLLERTAALGGTLAIDSSATGAKVEINLPLPE